MKVEDAFKIIDDNYWNEVEKHYQTEKVKLFKALKKRTEESFAEGETNLDSILSKFFVEQIALTKALIKMK